MHKPAKSPLIIAVAAGSAAGKKRVCEMIQQRVQELCPQAHTQMLALSLDSFYRRFTREELELARRSQFNFDHPDAFDWKLLHNTLDRLRRGLPVDVPEYDYTSFQRLSPESGEAAAANPPAATPASPDVVFIEGILVLYNRKIRDLVDMRIFLDVDSDIRLARQVVRDTEDRYQLPLDTVLTHYVQYVKPAFEDFVLPTKKFADVIIPRGESNTVAIDLIAQHAVEALQEPRGRRRSFSMMTPSSLCA